MRALAGRNELPSLRSDDLDDSLLAALGGVALGVVAGHRATFTLPNVYAEVSS